MSDVVVYRGNRPGCVGCLTRLIMIGSSLFICAFLSVLTMTILNIGELETQAATYAETIDDIETLSLEMKSGIANLTVSTLADSLNAFEAEVDYIGELLYDVSGTDERQISLKQQEGQDFSFAFPGFLNIRNWNGNDRFLWNVRLDPDIPLVLTITGGIGRNDLDLSALNLTSLDMSMGIGETHLRLPAPRNELTSVEIDGGVGSVIIEMPDNAAVRVFAQFGVGDVSFSDRFINTSAGNIPDMQTVRETPNFNESERKLVITFKGGVGNLEVR